ncbi:MULTISPECIES: hypothetical protein [unclassified Aureimonas]|uniref:hypothetical protein n=1 Tax=unclassified Aureimonas TaxID=2615206 RepID=UPI0012E34CCD|nr:MULTISPECIES: hypothetical protein [unclassified Aureimonas]
MQIGSGFGQSSAYPFAKRPSEADSLALGEPAPICSAGAISAQEIITARRPQIIALISPPATKPLDGLKGSVRASFSSSRRKSFLFRVLV